MAGLVIKRRPGQVIRIGPYITITIADIHGDYAKINIQAPRHLPVWRGEVGEWRDPAADPVDHGRDFD